MAEQQAHTLALGVRTPADPVVSWTVHRSDTGTACGTQQVKHCARERVSRNTRQGYPSEPTGFVDGACRHGRAARGRSRLGGRPRRPGGVGRFFFGAG